MLLLGLHQKTICVARCSRSVFKNKSGKYKSFRSYSSNINKNSRSNVRKPEWIPYSHENIGLFFQEKPKLCHPFISDSFLQRYLGCTVPKEVFNEISKDLTCFGERIVKEIDDLGRQCELNLPALKCQDAWGKRVDKLETCNAWKQQHHISAEEGLVAIGYERKLDEWRKNSMGTLILQPDLRLLDMANDTLIPTIENQQIYVKESVQIINARYSQFVPIVFRLHQVCKLYLYAPSSGMYSCPLAMTDGAAKTIEVLGSGVPKFKRAFENLTTRNPEKFWTSGQWMTERRGGSDVANGTETVAVPENDFYRLYGYKWFTSATDSNMALTLAKELRNSDDSVIDKGLTLFYLETRAADGCLNNIQIMRLKDKLGTRQVPTAELLLDGCIAYKMSEEGHGVAAIANMLNITRLYNAIGAIGGMRRILMLARDYSQNRTAFGKKLSDYPLHMQVLSRMEVEARGSLLLLLKVSILLGKSEVNSASPDEILLLRLLLPLLKLYTAKQAVSVVSEGLECFGGQGYMEDTGLPVMLRDAQVLPIWEGTTNILSLDVLRSFTKSNYEVFKSMGKSVQKCLELAKDEPEWLTYCLKIENSLKYVVNFIQNSPELLPVACRDLSYSLTRIYIGALFIENACKTKNEVDIATAKRWCDFQELCLLSNHHDKSSYNDGVHTDFKLVMEGYNIS